MERTIAWFLFIGLYCTVIHRWTQDYRNGIEPWLRRSIARLSSGRRYWSAPLSAWTAVLLVMLAVFSPVFVIWMAGRLGMIPWSLAYLLLLLTLGLSATLWMRPTPASRETR